MTETLFRVLLGAILVLVSAHRLRLGILYIRSKYGTGWILNHLYGLSRIAACLGVAWGAAIVSLDFAETLIEAVGIGRIRMELCVGLIGATIANYFYDMKEEVEHEPV